MEEYLCLYVKPTGTDSTATESLDHTSPRFSAPLLGLISNWCSDMLLGVLGVFKCQQHDEGAYGNRRSAMLNVPSIWSGGTVSKEKPDSHTWPYASPVTPPLPAQTFSVPHTRG